MADGPWNDYQAAPTSGPWEDYQPPAPTPARALAYGPVVGEHGRSQMVGPANNPLGLKDVALSPNLQDKYPLGSSVRAIDSQGNPIGDYQVADSSFYEPGRPTQNTIEFRDRDISNQGVSLTPSPPPWEDYQQGGDVTFRGQPTTPPSNGAATSKPETTPQDQSWWDKLVAFAKKPSPQAFQPAEKFIKTPLVSPETINSLFQPVIPASVAADPIAQGIGQGASEAASQFTSPGNLAMLPLIPEGMAGKAVAAGVTAQGLSQYPELYRQYQATNDPKERARILATAAVLAAPAAGLLPRGTAELPASKIPEDHLGVQEQRYDTIPAPSPVQGTPEYARVNPEDVQAKLAEPQPQEVTNASQITSPEGIPSPQVRPSVAEEAPLRQPGETAGVREQGIEGPAQPEQTPQVIPPEDIPYAPPDTTQLVAAKPQVPETPRTTGIAQRVHEQRGLGIKPGEGISAEEMVNRGRNLLGEGVNPDEVATRIKQTGSINADDISVLRAQQEQYAKATNAAEDVLRAKPNDPALLEQYRQAFKQEQDYAQNVVKPAQTLWHKIGMAQQGEVDIDTGTFSGLRRAVIDEKGRDVTPPEAQQLEQMAAKVREAQLREAEALKKLSDAMEQTKTRTTRPKLTPDQLKEHFSQRLRDLTPC